MKKKNYSYEFRGFGVGKAQGFVLLAYDTASLGKRIPDERNPGQLQLLVY
jgi:hypothetical protein